MSHSSYHIEIILKEPLEEHWSKRLGELSLATSSDGQTRLAGDVSDPAALHGILGCIRDFNLTLVSIHAVKISPDRR